MEKLKITEGIATVGVKHGDEYLHAQNVYVGHRATCMVFGVFNHFSVAEAQADPRCAEGLANAALYADAHNTYNSCHLLPSELRDREQRLTALLKEAENELAKRGLWFRDAMTAPVFGHLNGFQDHCRAAAKEIDAVLSKLRSEEQGV